MNPRTTIAGALLATTLTLSGAGIAQAHEVPPPEALCHRAEHQHQALERLSDRLDAKEMRLTARHDRAEIAGHTRLMERIEHQLAQNDRHQARVDARIAVVDEQIALHCPTAGAG